MSEGEAEDDMFAQIDSEIDEDDMFNEVAEFLAQISNEDRQTLQMLVSQVMAD